MICEVCRQHVQSVTYWTNPSGLIEPRCAQCVPQQPARLADGSHQGNRPMTDFADHFAREIDAAHTAMDAKEAALDRYGYAKPNRLPAFVSGIDDAFMHDRADEIRIAIARADAAIDCLRTLVKAWRKEMRGGYATTEQQHALRRAEEMIK